MQAGSGGHDSTLRFAAGRSRQRYPLPARSDLAWQQGSAANHWVARVTIEALQPGELLLPSVALLTSLHYAVRCSLTADAGAWRLTPINTDTSNLKVAQSTFAKSEVHAAIGASDEGPHSPVTTLLDVFAIHQPIDVATVVVELICDARPDDYLFVVSRRQQNLPGQLVHQPPTRSRPEVKVPNLSQMVQPSSQCMRTCSPTSLSMLMGYHGKAYHPAFVDRCKEPTTGLYGVWPLNIMQASRRGFVAAAELVSNWSQLAMVATPFVASIRFEPNQLTHAPLAQTAGHLVLVRGTTATCVLCSDPAAPTASTVERHYDLAQFTDAWLRHRGATYIAVPGALPADVEQHSEAHPPAEAQQRS